MTELAAKKREEFLCSLHDASTIAMPMDFFEPILQLKYGDEYGSLREEPWFKDLAAGNDKEGVMQLASLCVREESSENPNARRLPIFLLTELKNYFLKLTMVI